jgi:hypothetical protein
MAAVLKGSRQSGESILGSNHFKPPQVERFVMREQAKNIMTGLAAIFLAVALVIGVGMLYQATGSQYALYVLYISSLTVGFFGVFALAWVIGVYIRAFRGTLRNLEAEEASARHPASSVHAHPGG